MKTLWDYQKEIDGQSQEDPQTDNLDEARIEEERQELLGNVSSFVVNTLRDRVAWVLNHYPETRDSDIALQLKYWEMFENDIYDGHSIDPKDLYHLTRLTSLVRERARIQNTYKLFIVSTEIRQKRGTLSDEEKEKAVSDKPPHPLFVVYMDESGKTGNFLLIGSVWFLAGGRQTLTLMDEIHNLRETHNFRDEFHFKEMKPDELSIYKELVSLFLKHASDVSFKLVSLPRTGVGKVQDALAELFYHLLIKGVEHEDKTGRAPLPRSLQVWKDAEETGADKLLLANLEDRLRQASATLYKDKLTIDRLIAVGSERNPFLQMADLLVSSANRVMNRSGEKHTHKDEFAEFFLNAVKYDLSFSPNDNMVDNTVYIAL